MKIIFIRHGKTKSNTRSCYIGSTDEPLCEAGADGIRRREYPKADTVICSPMRRCLETAKIIYPDKKPRIYDGLRECDFGDFECKNHRELSGNPDYEKWLESGDEAQIPNGESKAAFSRRCADAFLTAANDCCGCGTAAFVVHGGTIMAVLEKYAVPKKGFYKRMLKNGQCCIADWDGEKITVEDVLE